MTVTCAVKWIGKRRNLWGAHGGTKILLCIAVVYASMGDVVSVMCDLSCWGERKAEWNCWLCRHRRKR